MKTVCRECDHPNDLGRLFCTECGAKLDMNAVNDDIEAQQESDKRKRGFKLLLIPVAGLLIGLVGLCLWAGKPFVSEDSQDGRRDTVDAVMWSLSQITRRPAGSTVVSPRALRECDLNDWLGYLAMEKPASSMSVNIGDDGKVTLRVIHSVGPWPIMSGKINLGPKDLSYDLIATPQNGELNITMARFGHCPLVGPLTRIIEAQAAKLFSDREIEKTVLNYASEITVEDREIMVTVTSTE